MEIERHVNLAQRELTNLAESNVVANYFCQPTTIPEIQQALELCREEGIPHMIRGLGKQSIIDKSGFPGMVISLKYFNRFELYDPEDAELELDRTEINVGQTIGARFCAGVSTLDITRNFKLVGLNGLEFLSGYSNSLGSMILRNRGGLFENLSAHKLEIMYLDRELNIRIKPWSKIKYEYYNSGFYGNGIILMLDIELGRIEQDDYFRNVMNYAISNPHFELGKTGIGPIFKPLPGEEMKMVFKNSSLGGFEAGGCRWNRENENYIERSGNASSADVLTLMLEAKNRVREQFGIELEPRIDYFGPKSPISLEIFGIDYPFTIDPVYYQYFDHSGE